MLSTFWDSQLRWSQSAPMCNKDYCLSCDICRHCHGIRFKISPNWFPRIFALPNRLLQLWVTLLPPFRRLSHGFKELLLRTNPEKNRHLYRPSRLEKPSTSESTIMSVIVRSPFRNADTQTTSRAESLLTPSELPIYPYDRTNTHSPRHS